MFRFSIFRKFSSSSSEKSLFDLVSEMRERGGGTGTGTTNTKSKSVSGSRKSNQSKRQASNLNRLLGTRDVKTVGVSGLLPLESSSGFGQKYLFPLRDMFSFSRTTERAIFLIPGLLLFVGVPALALMLFGDDRQGGRNNSFARIRKITNKDFGNNNNNELMSMENQKHVTTTTTTIIRGNQFVHGILFSSSVFVSTFICWKIAKRIQKSFNVGVLLSFVSCLYFILALPKLEQKKWLLSKQQQQKQKQESESLFYAQPAAAKPIAVKNLSSTDAEPSTTNARYCVSLKHQETSLFGPVVDASQNLVVTATEEDLMQQQQNNLHRNNNKNNEIGSDIFFLPNVFHSEWGSRVTAMDALTSWANEKDAKRLPTFFSPFILSEVVKTNEWYDSFSTPYDKK